MRNKIAIKKITVKKITFSVIILSIHAIELLTIMTNFIKLRNYFAISTLAIAGFVAGWFSFQALGLSSLGMVDGQRFAASVILLVSCWHYFAKSKMRGFFILFGWYLGATASIPSEWGAFFGNNHGIIGWIAFAGIAAIPVLAIPNKYMKYGLVIAALTLAITPLGITNPILASAALFPGMRLFGLVLAIFVLALPAMPEKPFVIALIAFGFFGVISNTRYVQPHAPYSSITKVTWLGAMPRDQQSMAWYQRQRAMALNIKQDVHDGAKLAIAPEGTTDNWSSWSSYIWDDATKLAQDKQAQVLVGVYKNNNGIWRDGLLDIANNRFYPSSFPMLFGMWHPWDAMGHFPMNFSALTQIIPTQYGDAAYVVCYEETLLLPLTAKMITNKPKLIIGIANQWFTNPQTSIAQSRSIQIQARLWNLPLLRSVNFSNIQS